MTNRRTLQISSAIERAVREVLARGLSDPRVSGLITVTDVKLNDDLAEAVVGVSVLPEEKESLTLHGIQAATSHIRREVGKLVQSRQLPQLRFELDRTLKKQAGVLRVIDQASADLERRKAQGLLDPAPADATLPAQEDPTP